ncbi:MAG: hypothetical protein ACYDH3_08090 [Candidatus Aminicenantales bacterium]
MTLESRSASFRKNPASLLWTAGHFLILMFAVWLVSPLIVITPSDYLVKNSYGLRLALGLLIFIMYIGKWSFDVFAPQGLAREVSRLRSVALVLYILVVVSFMIFIVAQAASLYLQTGIDKDKADQIESLAYPGEVPSGPAKSSGDLIIPWKNV